MLSILKKLREKYNFTQEDLAKELNISRPTLVNIEQGKTELTVSQAKIVSGLFNVSLEFIVNNKMPPEIEILITSSKENETNTDTKIQERISVREEHIDKFKEVLLYILNKIGSRPNVGQAVLYKLLYFIDFDFYEKYEKHLIGAHYIKNHYGPTPVCFAKIISIMEEEDSLEEVKSNFFGKGQTKYLPHKEASLSKLNAEELNHIDEIIAKYGNMTAAELRDFSHKDIPWIISEDGKPIDYESVFYRTPETSVRKYPNKDV
jgi:transcriptional regulator with XRE-family HTH domain